MNSHIGCLGVIGKGFVGEAVYEGMKHAFAIETYDKDPKKSTTSSIQELAEKSDIIFICLPTPMRQDGSCDTSIVESVLIKLNLYQKVVVIKSTIPPGSTEKYNQTYKNISCVFNPEFLTEANYINDFKNQDRIIIGGPHEAVTLVKQMYQIAYPNVPTTKTSSTIAELVKYMTNCFLATKVAFANEIYQICKKLDVDYDKVVEYSTKDKRLGTSHWAVPGPMPAPDGSLKPGFSGSCLCKDINALIYKAKQLGIDPKVMRGAWEKNLEVRPERDWEQLKGRAVS